MTDTIDKLAQALQEIRDQSWTIAQAVSNVRKPMEDNDYGKLCAKIDSFLAAHSAQGVGDGAMLDWLSDMDNAADIGVYGITDNNNLRERIRAAMLAAPTKETP